MKNILKNGCIIALSLNLFSSCVNDTYDKPVAQDCVNPGLAKTKEVSDIYAVAINPVPSPIIPNTPTYLADDIIEAYMISSDEGGNFYKSMYLQPLDGSKGFNISEDIINAYTKHLQPGRKVYVKLKGLAYGNPTNYAVGLVFGAPPTDKYTVDRLSTYESEKHIIPSCDIISEDAIVHNNLTVAQAKSDTYLNTLVEIKDVQFESEGGTYDPNTTDTSDGSAYVTDGTTSIPIRTSRYANFAGYRYPSGRGTVRGVLTKYNSSYQIILRTERDVNLPNPRVDNALPIVGNALSFSGAISENFTSYTLNQTNFPKYINDAFLGTRYWQIKQYPTGTGNKYIEMSSYAGATAPGVNAKTYFFVPVDFTAANAFAFKKEIRYNKGPALKVYYVTDVNYVAGSAINIDNFVDITSSFNITYPAIDASENSFSSPGTFTIPGTLTGNGYFVFEYTGNETITTTVQIDDILIN